MLRGSISNKTWSVVEGLGLFFRGRCLGCVCWHDQHIQEEEDTHEVEASGMEDESGKLVGLNRLEASGSSMAPLSPISILP